MEHLVLILLLAKLLNLHSHRRHVTGASYDEIR